MKYNKTLDGDCEFGPYAEEYNEIVRDMSGIYGEAEHPYVGPTDGYHSDFRVFEADFSNLPEIVTEEYKKYLKTKRR